MGDTAARLNRSRLVPVGTTLPATTIDEADRAPASSSSIVIEHPGGALYASLRFARVRGVRYEFALDVVNAAPYPILATVYAQPAFGEEVPVAPFSLWIDAQTEAYVFLPLPLLALFTCRSLTVRLQGRGVHQRLAAAVPRPSALIWSLGGALVAALLIGGGFAAHPRITSLTMPTNAVGGEHASVSYALANTSHGTWELDDLRGGRLDGGVISTKTGSFSVALPRANDRETYLLAVHAQGFGSAVQSVPIVADTPAPSGPPLRVSALSLDQAVVSDGGTVTVRYRVDSANGEVLAVDAQGTIWARTPLSPSGVTTLKLPTFGKDKELQIRVVARRGTQLAQAGVGVQITASPTAQPFPSQGATISIDTDTVHPGGSIAVHIVHYIDGMRVALVNATGMEIDVRDVQPGESEVTLRVPFSSTGMLSVVATYMQGDMENSDVRHVRVQR